MTTIAFVRHGNTDWNNEKRAQGHMHNPLNDLGRKQAAAVAERLSGEHWDVFFSSDLLRARETAEAISHRIGMPVTGFDQRLREIYRGKIEGTVEEERIRTWGKDWRKLDLGEEGLEDLRARGTSFVAHMLERFPGKKILVVSHGLIISQTLKALFQDETFCALPHNTSITVIRRTKAGWEYVLCNCIRHLGEEEIG